MNRQKLAMISFYSFLAALIIFLFFFNITLKFNLPEDAKIGVEIERAKVINIISDTQEPDPQFSDVKIGIQTIEFEILTGENKGKTVTAKNFIGRVDNHPAKTGTVMILASYDDFATATVENYSRENVLYILALIFFVLVLIFGKKKGAKSIAALLFTLGLIVFLFIPLIIRGMNAVPAAVIMVILSAVVSHVLINGFTKKTFVATVSCIACTAFAGIIALAVGQIANISTLNTAEAEDLFFISSNTSLKIHDLFFAGILIASLGAITDTTMSIASSLCEMKELNPRLTEKQLLISGMNIGRDIMGTMTDTLILAFTGSSINILVIYYMYKMSALQLLNIDLLVVEIIQGLSGSIAVILSIPATAVIGAKIFAKNQIKHIATNKKI